MRILLLIAALVTASPAFAHQSPWQRVCRISQGIHLVLNVQDPVNELPLCFYGNSAVGSESLFNLKTGAGKSLALNAYERGGSDCTPAGGVLVEGVLSPEGFTYTVCKFSDNSLIEEGTLVRGIHHPANQALDRALEN